MRKKLSRKKAARKSLVKNLATSLIFYEKIETTLAKGKTVVPYVERILRIAQSKDLASRRRIIAMLADKKAVKKIFADISNRLGERKNGFCQIVKLPNRRSGDNAEMVKIILLLEAPKIEKVEEKSSFAKATEDKK